MIFAPPTLKDGHRWRGMRIGLLGGSFNPPHIGHLHIARLAQAKFGLHAVWWIITPQNPLKDKAGIAPYKERFHKVEDMLSPYPAMIPTHLENELSTKYTFQTVKALKASFPESDLLWI